MIPGTLDSITIRGFKSIASATVELRPINIVIGANGSGKSNFVGAFEFLRAVGEGRLRDYVIAAGGAEKVLHFGSKITQKISLSVSFNPRPATRTLDLTLAPTLDDSLFSVGVAGIHRGMNSPGDWQLPDKDAISLSTDVELWQLYHLADASAMRKTAEIEENRFLRPDATNLSALLYLLRERYEDSYNLIVDTVRQVAPFFDDFRLRPRELNAETILLEWRHKKSDQYFHASSLSDGTLRFIALATLFLDPRRNRRSLILVDEPELGLHPSAIELLASLIQQAALDTQVIVSTQSSLLVDHFEPKDILVAERVDGGTQLTRPDSARLEKWLEDYSLGQLWEKNELGGRPGPD